MSMALIVTLSWFGVALVLSLAAWMFSEFDERIEAMLQDWRG